MVLPIAEYADFFVLCTKHDLGKLQHMQNRALRLCFEYHPCDEISTCKLHQDARLDTLNVYRATHILNIMYMNKDRYAKTSVLSIATRNSQKQLFPIYKPNINVYKHL